MQTISASQAKQNFGALIGLLAQGPVAVQRHGKAVAIVMAPQSGEPLPDARQLARQAQQQRELQRLVRHQQLAIELLCAPARTRRAVLQAARKVVARWHSEQLCSADYIERWSQWLNLPLPELAQQMCGAAAGWGPAMRQNSPFVVATGTVAP
jgi:hypothetical protein